MNNWYVMKVVLGKERLLKERLTHRVGTEHSSIIRFLCPVEKEYYSLKGKKHIRDRVIYGGYLYMETEKPLDKEAIEAIIQDQDVKHFLPDNERPTKLRESDVNRIIKDEVLEERIANKIVSIDVGTKVKINEGAFLNFYGFVNELDRDKNKVFVAVKIFGRETITELSISQVEKVYE